MSSLVWRPVLGALLLMLGACAPLHRYPDGTGLEGQLEREVVALKLRIQELEAQLERAPVHDSSNSLVPELVQVFSGSGVLVSPQARGAKLTVPIQLIYADPGNQRLRDEGTMVFDLLATAILKHKAYEVHMIGHWSDRPVPSRNRGTVMELTLDLARVFADRVIEEGVPPARILVGGLGPHAPVTSNDLKLGQDANQRIEVLLVLPPPAIE